MIIQEPIKATITYALENYAFSDAIFLSERLYAEVKTDDNLYILATAYYRSGKPNIAYSILSRNKYDPLKSPSCPFLLAKCCIHLEKYEEAISILLQPISSDFSLLNKTFPMSDLTNVYGELSSFVAQCLGQLFYRIDDSKSALHYYELSLKLNPFLWSSYETLLQIDPSKAEYRKMFNFEKFDLKYSCGTNPLITLLNSSSSIEKNFSELVSLKAKPLIGNESSQSYFSTPEIDKNSQNFSKKIELSTPYAVLKQSPGNNKVDVITPETNGVWQMMTCLAPTKNTPRNNRKFNSQTSQVLIETSNFGVNQKFLDQTESSGYHSFGVLSLDEEYLNFYENHNQSRSSKSCINKSKITTRSRVNLKKTNDDPMIIDDQMEIPKATGISTRRSSRLNTDSRSIKENAAANTANKLDRSVTPMKRCRRIVEFDRNEKSVKEQKENSISLTSNEKVLKFDLTHTGVKTQRSSAVGLIELITKFSIAYKYLAEYKCKEAIKEFEKLPINHRNTGLVLSMIGRCYFEMGKYEDSISYFNVCRAIEPYRLQGLEIFSTALWHLQRELELSCLSQDLIQFDKLAPETWCVAGNCFSLQKDHEISIKFLRRAIQVDPNFFYAYTLLGHELISADELENAMSCFRNATRINQRHYNAWCGIGLIYYKQEKFDHAAINYKRALEISPHNPILIGHLAIVYHHLKKSNNALSLLDEALKIDSNNVLIKYHRASIRFSLEQYPQALEELEDLKKMVPKESMIYFLIGKIHKHNGDTHLAVSNFSWAVHIDPKGSTNQHKEFTEPNQNANDDLVVHPSHTEASNSSTPITATPFTQRSTYITGSINNSIALNDHNLTTEDIDQVNEFLESSSDEPMTLGSHIEPRHSFE